MKTFREKYQGGEFSQNGEQGILDEILRRLNLTGGTAIEFGAPTKQYCSNIFHLGPGWEKIYYDPDPNDNGIIQMYVTVDNVNSLPACQVLSIDIDGQDHDVWAAYNGNPPVVIIEINSSYPPTSPGPISDPKHGTAYWPMMALASEKGYFLVCHTGNLVLCRNEYRDLFPEIIGNGIDNYNEYFKSEWL